MSNMQHPGSVTPRVLLLSFCVVYIYIFYVVVCAFMCVIVGVLSFLSDILL